MVWRLSMCYCKYIMSDMSGAEKPRLDGDEFYDEASKINEELDAIKKGGNTAIVDTIISRDEAREDAIRDPLTSLYNRGFIIETLETEVARTVRNPKPISVIMIDSDDFKAINDQWGHLTGDRVLVCLAEAMKAGVRKVDVPGRYGGDEFIVLLPETNEEEAVIVAERIQKKFEESMEVEFKESDEFAGLTSKISIGVGERSEGEKTDATALIKKADEALYLAKEQGGNKVVAYTEVLTQGTD